MSMSTTQPAFTVNLPTLELPKGEQEYRAFLQLLPDLLPHYRGRYVAVHNGQVVDSDEDEVKLILRAQAKVGYVPICVGLVAEPQPVARIPHYREVQPQREP
ncbi:MAG: hypothetical protein IT429_03720 [Gemmataceae bacterium]|nr:hypothetical protein [Gemmataceae bacterium]